MGIAEQVKELRQYVEAYEKQPFGREVEGTVKVLSDAADTIEALSANLQAANMEWSAEDCGEWIPCKKRLPEKDTDVLIRYYNSKEGKSITDIAWIDEDGNWKLTREEAGYFPPNFKKEIKKWMPLPED